MLAESVFQNGLLVIWRSLLHSWGRWKEEVLPAKGRSVQRGHDWILWAGGKAVRRMPGTWRSAGQSRASEVRQKKPRRGTYRALVSSPETWLEQQNAGGGAGAAEAAGPGRCSGGQVAITFSCPPTSALSSTAATREFASEHNREMERRWIFSGESSG